MLSATASSRNASRYVYFGTADTRGCGVRSSARAARGARGGPRRRTAARDADVAAARAERDAAAAERDAERAPMHAVLARNAMLAAAVAERNELLERVGGAEGLRLARLRKRLLDVLPLVVAVGFAADVSYHVATYDSLARSLNARRKTPYASPRAMTVRTHRILGWPGSCAARHSWLVRAPSCAANCCACCSSRSWARRLAAAILRRFTGRESVATSALQVHCSTACSTVAALVWTRSQASDVSLARKLGRQCRSRASPARARRRGPEATTARRRLQLNLYSDWLATG